MTSDGVTLVPECLKDPSLARVGSQTGLGTVMVFQFIGGGYHVVRVL
jgi:hypothetical protein